MHRLSIGVQQHPSKETVAENPEFFWPVLAQHIKGNYGHLRIDKATYDRKKSDGTITQQEKEDYECPGPFSLIGYLKALLKRKFWGDEMVFIISSMMWQVGITFDRRDPEVHQVQP